jgi:sugar lactone lactonase YvrE
MEPYRGGFLVTDGHHNRVLHVELDGGITEVIAFDNIVPTGLEVRGNTVYMAQAGPVPHVPADGKVVSFRPRSATAREVASGSPLLVDVEFGRGNSLYALSQGDWEGTFEGDPAAPDTGALVRVNRNGTFTTVEDGLDRPSSLEFIGNTAYFVSLSGEVWRIDDVSGPPFGDGRRSVAGLSTPPSSAGANGILRVMSETLAPGVRAIPQVRPAREAPRPVVPRPGRWSGLVAMADDQALSGLATDLLRARTRRARHTSAR